MLWPQKTFQDLFPQIQLKGSRIIMRPPAQSDWAQWVRVRADNKDHIQPFEPQWSSTCFDKEFFLRRIKRQAREWKIGHANAFLIFEPTNNALIGGMNINNICRGAAQYATLGYWVDKSHEGRGYMAESLQLTLEYCFEDLALHRVNASCLPHNHRSKKTLLNAGFTEEGFAEKYLQINAEWQDHILFGLPVERWQENAGELRAANVTG